MQATETPTQLTEVERLRITVAHLQLQNAQMQVQALSTARDELIRATLRRYVAEGDIVRYVIDLEAGTVRPREEVPVWEPTP